MVVKWAWSQNLLFPTYIQVLYSTTHHWYMQPCPQALQYCTLKSWEWAWGRGYVHVHKCTLSVMYMYITESGRKRVGGPGGYSSGGEKKKKRMSISDEPG